MKTRNKGRAPGQTQISVSVPESLLAELDAIAKEDGRNRSNTVVHLLRQQIKARAKAEPAIVPATPEQVAEAIRSGHYSPEVLLALTLAREAATAPRVQSSPRAKGAA